MCRDKITSNIKLWGQELGFVCVGITDLDIQYFAQKFHKWLENNYHADMDYMQKYAELRSNPKALMPNVQSVIVCALNYFNVSKAHKNHIANYALGRDYHKIMRKRLEKLAQKMLTEIGNFNYRCFVDSGPVLEKPLAVKAGIGWQGKNSLIINRDYGSWLVLGEIFTDLKLHVDKPQANRCGDCDICIKACPTKAIVAPYVIDARRCIAYLTIEHKGSIPENLRSLLGGRVYGCDVCQRVCPMNRCAKETQVQDFLPRHNLHAMELIELCKWSEEEFLRNTEGSAIRRIGYKSWLRNTAGALGNDHH